MMARNYDDLVERLLNELYWVIDVLPCQVPQGARGQFFAVEKYYLQEPQHERLCGQFADVLLKLNCYYDLHVNHCDKWVKNPAPATLASWLACSLQNGHLCALVDEGEALLTASGGDIYMTLYNPSPEMVELVRQLASAAGLFLWQPPKE